MHGERRRPTKVASRLSLFTGVGSRSSLLAAAGRKWRLSDGWDLGDDEVEAGGGGDPEDDAVVLKVGRRRVAVHHLDDPQLRPVTVDGPHGEAVCRRQQLRPCRPQHARLSLSLHCR